MRINSSFLTADQSTFAEQYRLQILGQYNVLALPPDPSLTRIAQSAAKLSDSTVGLVSMVDRDQLVFMAGADELPCQTLPRKSSLCDSAIRGHSRFEVPNVKADPRFDAYWRDDHPLYGLVASYAGVPLRAPEGLVLGMLCVIGSSIRRLAEVQWKALEVLAESAMRVLEGRARATRSLGHLGGMIDSLDSEFVLLDSKTLDILYGNAGVAQRVGVRTSDLPEMALHDIYPSGACEQVHRARAILDLDTSARITTVPLEFSLRRFDGAVRRVRGSIQRRGWQGGQALVIVTTDTSALTHERAPRAAAKAANLAKSEFLARISHEVRTSLNAVLGFSQLLLSQSKETLSERQVKQLKVIHQSGWHLLDLMNDVLDISRIETGNLAVQPQDLPLTKLLDQLLDSVSVQANESRVALRPFYRDQETAHAWGDPLRVRQALLNLLTNAIKFNKQGGEVRVSVCVEAADGLVEVRVEDTGLGMTPEQLAHLFEPFHRLGREGSGIEGTGIGLALSKQLFELMGGHLTIESKAGQGTCAHATLPLAARSTAQSTAQLPATSLLAPVPAPRSTKRDPMGTVLYVEDNTTNVMLVEEVIERMPQVRMVVAETGEKGIELARVLQPDIILLDMNLPDLNGLQVLERLRADSLTQGVPVVVVSANAMSEDLQGAKQGGASDYWIKPLDLQRFETNLRRMLIPE